MMIQIIPGLFTMLRKKRMLIRAIHANHDEYENYLCLNSI